MNDTAAELAAQAKKLEEQGLLGGEAAEFVARLLAEMDTLRRQNGNLRRAALKSSKQDRMSTKLKEALYE